MMPEIKALSVSQLNRRLSDAIAMAPGVRDVWVVAETSDLRQSGGHRYLELVEKGPDGANISRIRANIWAGQWVQINALFRSVTGVDLASGMKIMAQVTATYHPNYGMSVAISRVDPTYTVGDAERVRREILARLKAEGIAERNRSLRWSHAPLRLAVVSSRGAAGYGDFVNQLYSNPWRFRFDVTLFQVSLQGEATARTIVDALRRIGSASGADAYDGVVIIRGGGSTTDLAAFDNYELARAVALCPVPVIVGIGHERDVTVLDSVANMRVKTPTAAAEWLVARAKALLDALGRAAERIYAYAAEQISANREMLARTSAMLPGCTSAIVARQRNVLERCSVEVGSRVRLRLERQMALLGRTAGEIDSALGLRLERENNRLSRAMWDVDAAVRRRVESEKNRLDRLADMADLLSPRKVMSRGFSLTCGPDGRAVRSASQLRPGVEIRTYFADDSEAVSEIKKTR